MVTMTVLLTGFLTCLALIVAIGPQSAWLLRQGLLRDRVGLAVLCCVVGDLLLIGLGTAGVGAVLEHAPWLLQVLRWAGVATCCGSPGGPSPRRPRPAQAWTATTSASLTPSGPPAGSRAGDGTASTAATSSAAGHG
ncbi:LysE/ArgO family amino acid transporter, partial [Nesterenkonia sp. PF2B19]|uniref:LysE/ArgO family amino acid transporter n=1 Tax=Nesterenkonia sp. PF2B19 TaxID=1881858 RepID=UPI001F029F95